MRIAIALALATLLGASIPAGAAEWRTHVYETDQFSVDFSGPVAVKPTPVDETTQNLLVRTTVYVQGDDLYAYAAAATLLKPDTPFDFDAAVKGTLANRKCARTDADTTTPTPGGKTREVYSSGCDGGKIRLGTKFISRGSWFYQVQYSIATDAPSEDAKRFLASFKLIEPKP